MLLITVLSSIAHTMVLVPRSVLLNTISIIVHIYQIPQEVVIIMSSNDENNSVGPDDDDNSSIEIIVIDDLAILATLCGFYSEEQIAEHAEAQRVMDLCARISQTTEIAWTRLWRTQLFKGRMHDEEKQKAAAATATAEQMLHCSNTTDLEASIDFGQQTLITLNTSSDSHPNSIMVNAVFPGDTNISSFEAFFIGLHNRHGMSLVVIQKNSDEHPYQCCLIPTRYLPESFHDVISDFKKSAESVDNFKSFDDAINTVAVEWSNLDAQSPGSEAAFLQHFACDMDMIRSMKGRLFFVQNSNCTVGKKYRAIVDRYICFRESSEICTHIQVLVVKAQSSEQSLYLKSIRQVLGINSRT